MLKLVEPIDRHDEVRNTAVSFLASLFFHLLLAVLLWWLVYNTVRQQSIALTGSTATGDETVAMEFVNAPAAESDALDSEIDSPADVTETLREPLISGVQWQASTAATTGSETANGQPASVDFFGVHAYGTRFVFVLDMSNSMSARNGERYQRAKAELVRAVRQLRPGQEYYVYMFCWRLTYMFHQSRSSDYVKVADGHVEKLQEWIESVSLDGGTDPRRALSLARLMKPDAVFLLTDGQFNHPSYPHSYTGWIDEQGVVSQEEVLIGVQRFYQQLPIHTIAFENPFTQGDMQAIAELTGGEHRYVKTDSLQPLDTKRLLTALRHVAGLSQVPSQEYQARLSHAREFIEAGELVYAEYLLRPLRHISADKLVNPRLRDQLISVLDAELGPARLEDFEQPPEMSEILTNR